MWVVKRNPNRSSLKKSPTNIDLNLGFSFLLFTPAFTQNNLVPRGLENPRAIIVIITPDFPIRVFPVSKRSSRVRTGIPHWCNQDWLRPETSNPLPSDRRAGGYFRLLWCQLVFSIRTPLRRLRQRPWPPRQFRQTISQWTVMQSNWPSSWPCFRAPVTIRPVGRPMAMAPPLPRLLAAADYFRRSGRRARTGWAARCPCQKTGRHRYNHQNIF